MRRLKGLAPQCKPRHQFMHNIVVVSGIAISREGAARLVGRGWKGMRAVVGSYWPTMCARANAHLKVQQRTGLCLVLAWRSSTIALSAHALIVVPH
jgi:hypothetical protein